MVNQPLKLKLGVVSWLRSSSCSEEAVRYNSLSATWRSLKKNHEKKEHNPCINEMKSFTFAPALVL
jgi:hypothetical protein